MADLTAWNSDVDWEQFIETLPIPMMIFRADGLMVAMNTASEEVWQFSREAFVGHYNILRSPASVATGADAMFAQVLQGHLFTTEPALYDTSNMLIDHPNPRLFWVQRTVFPIYDYSGNITNVGMIHRDASQEIAQQAIVATQQATIRALSTPVIQLWDNIVLVPLIGAIDQVRGTALMEQLLESLIERQADTVIVDLTGVPDVDTVAATALLQANKAVRLVGATIIFAGLRPSVAHLLTELEVPLEDLVIKATLQDSLDWSLQQRGLQIMAL